MSPYDQTPGFERGGGQQHVEGDKPTGSPRPSAGANKTPLQTEIGHRDHQHRGEDEQGTLQIKMERSQCRFNGLR